MKKESKSRTKRKAGEADSRRIDAPDTMLQKPAGNRINLNEEGVRQYGFTKVEKRVW